MNISGTERIAAPREQVWTALQDPAVLARTLPGCVGLVATGDDTYEATMEVGVASIRGTYRGTVRLTDAEPPASYRMHVAGAGVPGTVDANVAVRLDETDGATAVSYDADAQVGGMIGGVGQRMLGGVAKRMAGEFFRAVERDLAGAAEGAVPPGDERSNADAATATEAPATTVGSRPAFAPPTRAAVSEGRPTELVSATVAGGLLALAGVLVGRRLGRSGRR